MNTITSDEYDVIEFSTLPTSLSQIKLRYSKI